MNPSLLGRTKTKILKHLLEKRRTATELSGLLQIQVSATRKHLEDLCEMEIVSEVFLQKGLGRPKKFYALTEEGRELFPRQYEAILGALLSRVEAETDKTFEERIAKEIASDLVSELSLEGDTSEKHMHALASAMTDFGFFTSLKEKGKGYEIQSKNCPFYKAALAHPKLFCEDLHTEMLKLATGSNDVELKECAVMGDSQCIHVVKKGKNV